MSDRVAAVVVTFNRKKLLLECLEALKKQTRPVDAIFIIDGPSTDGTPEALKKAGYIQELPPSDYNEYSWSTQKFIRSLKNTPIKVIYVRLYEDVGGAGGFHEGIKRAYQEGYDYIWLMDDDGKPEHTCLEKLISAGLRDDTVFGPVVLDIESKEYLSFPTICKGKYISTYTDLINTLGDDILCDNGISFFNGILISAKIVSIIGYPKKEMFMWGDEYEYYRRMLTQGIKCYMVKNAIYYHPINKIKKIAFLGILKAPMITVRWKEYIFWRNSGYITRVYHPFFGVFHALWNISLIILRDLVMKRKKLCTLLFIFAYLEGYFKKFRDKKSIYILTERFCNGNPK